MNELLPITVSYGNGIGPEIMDAVLRVLESANAKIKPEIIDITKDINIDGKNIIFSDSFWESINRTHIFLSAPINYSTDLYNTNIEDILEEKLGVNKYIFPYYPFLSDLEIKNQNRDILCVIYNNRESYPGIEYRQTQNVIYKINSIYQGDIRNIIYDVIELAIINQRKKISFLIYPTTYNLLDETFINNFTQISQEYPSIKTEYITFDKLIENLNTSDNTLDVFLILNPPGKLLIELIKIKGFLGIAGFGKQYSIFKSIQNASSEIAGKNQANPTGLLIAAVMMLNYINQSDVANKIQSALLKTIADGIHTKDIFSDGITKELVGTQEFANAIINNLNQPFLENILPHPVIFNQQKPELSKTSAKDNQELVGLDLYIDWNKGSASDLGDMLKRIATDNLRLEFIANRGKIVYPSENYETIFTDHWLCRYVRKDIVDVIKHTEIIELLNKIYDTGFDFTKVELLYNFNGKPGYFTI